MRSMARAVDAAIADAASPTASLPPLVGTGDTATLADGRTLPVVQLNNAATTPPLQATLAAVNQFLGHYGALHRGAGPRARRTCDAVEAAIADIRRFVGASDDHALLFTENTSAAINQFARLLPLAPDDVVLTSEIEHTSNNLPWRFNTGGRVEEIAAHGDGGLDYDDLADKVSRLGDRVKLIAVSGASNQTGYIPDLARLAAVARSVGARLFVDAAQLAPHRPIDMTRTGIDALALSAHKIYAPFGLGVLALPRAMLATRPINPGGGSIDMISEDGVVWAPAAERHQTGTWNGVGIVALAASCRALEAAGWDAIVAHERALAAHMADRLQTVPGLTMHVPPDSYRDEDRVGAFPFTVAGLHHALVAAVLEHEYAIEVRAGTICNHRLVRRWFGVDDAGQRDVERRIAGGDRLASYGIVRASLGIQNTAADIDALVDALQSIVQRGPRRDYRPEPSHETYEPI